MRKAGLLARLCQIKALQDEELEEIRAMEVIDVLLDYINDAQVREAVEEIAL